jgi:hypothetical protein
MGLALAYAFDLRRMQGVDLAPALLVALLQHPTGQIEWSLEDRFEVILAGDSPVSIAICLRVHRFVRSAMMRATVVLGTRERSLCGREDRSTMPAWPSAL